LVVAGLVLAFGGVALRKQRKELELASALSDADARRARDEQLERENRAATMLTLAAGMAHEVLTPLSVIAGRAEQIGERANGPDDRTQRSVNAILEQSNRIREVVRGFLRFARGDAANFGRVDPERIVRSAVALVEHRFAKAGVRLRVEIDPSIPAVRGEERLLDQALVNLLLNACDACERGGLVEVTATHGDGFVTLAVCDDGIGISAAHAARVVEPFFSTKSSDQGSGLGLAVTNEIVAIHRGTLALEPREPRGTRASIRVPVAGQEANDALA
jgi:signal transduction histidine kinase